MLRIWFLPIGAVAAFKMVPFEGTEIPFAANAVSEAVLTATRWAQPNHGLTIEFVHIHKSGGMTFNALASALSCGLQPNVSMFQHPDHASENCARKMCCLIRPHPSLKAALASWVGDSPPRFVSARDELSAFERPWTPLTLKVVMVRRPFVRWVSEVEYGCRSWNRGPPPNISKLQPRSWHHHGYYKNKIFEHLIPPVLAAASVYTGKPLDSKRLNRARNVVYAFAFVGITEHFESSMCLFVRCFAPAVLCDYCCGYPLPKINSKSAAARHPECIANYTDVDRRQFDQDHRADYQAYEIALDVFQARLRRATDENWGGDVSRCACREIPS